MSIVNESPSCFTDLYKDHFKLCQYLEMQSIDLLEGDVWGHRKATLAERMASQEPDFTGKNVWSHRKCINEYSEVSQSIYDRIAEYREEGLSDNAIVVKMSEELQMGIDLIRLLLKNKK